MTDIAIQFFTKTSDAWSAMLQDIDQAKKTICIEQYIFAIDLIGNQFLELLQKKAQEGVKIKLICDTVGSWSFYRSPVPDLLQKQGIEVKFFNPIRAWRAKGIMANFLRDHRKIMIVDGKIGHIGGVGIQDHMADWRDTHMRCVGSIVDDLHDSFLRMWERATKSFTSHFKHVPQFIKKYNVLTNAPRYRQRYMYQALIANIRNARRYIFLTTPYFIPDSRLYRVLRLAAQRGVDVRILVPEVADHLFINHARAAYFSLALKAGIRIYLYKPGMLHAKTATIDDVWGTAGSFNLDSLSFLFNYEANISSDDGVFIAELKKHFFQDIEVAKELTLETWEKRPLRQKFLEFLTWPFHGIM